MKIETNVSLSSLTTFKMGGNVKKLYIPECEDELIDLLAEIPSPHYIIGGGSNLLINDKKEFDAVISLGSFDKRIELQKDGSYYVGASVRLQKLIKEINENGYGGIEYLFSVPGFVGGAIVMNAGRGNSTDEIGKRVIKVKAIVNGEVCEISRADCKFTRRSSIFKNSDMLVLGGYFQFEKGEPSFFKELCKQRISYVKETQDNSLPNFGTVFYKSNYKLMKVIRFFSKRKSDKVFFSNKTTNWMLNNGGTFEEAIRKIEQVKKLHRLIRKPCETEVIIWE